MLAKPAKKGYTYPSGADLIRCVGGVITCAGACGLPPSGTAAIFYFHSHIIAFEQLFVNWFLLSIVDWGENFFYRMQGLFANLFHNTIRRLNREL